LADVKGIFSWGSIIVDYSQRVKGKFAQFPQGKLARPQ